MSAQSIFFVYWNLAIQNHAGLTELFINTGVIDAALAALRSAGKGSDGKGKGTDGKGTFDDGMTDMERELFG